MSSMGNNFQIPYDIYIEILHHTISRDTSVRTGLLYDNEIIYKFTTSYD